MHPDQAQNTSSGIQGQEATAVAVIYVTAPVTASFPLISNYSALISHLSVAVVSALSARRLAWLLRFICVLAVCGRELVSGFVWKRVHFGLTDDDDDDDDNDEVI